MKDLIGESCTGWLNFNAGMENSSDVFIKPTGEFTTKNSDIMMLYFTSGTTVMPKMVNHNYIYPLGHILTAKYWQNVQDKGLHFIVADTGWAKLAWGMTYAWMEPKSGLM